jgi:hypothetical protein
MFNIFLRSYRKLIKDLSEAQMDTKLPSPKEQEEERSLENACSQITIYLREDGEFAVATDFTRQTPEVVDVTGVLLHMINSGDLAEYFIKSLKLWSEGETEQEDFAKEIIKKWKKLFYETSTDELASLNNDQLAVDPSDVFGLKGMK